ncbi:MAG: DUF4236 domain-containing protein [Candidatus Methylomirabilis oxygeniifera]|nr:MAG: DUF4236 domain-containing protein [Candidatus Methylomirabilis oxyfera]
MGLRFRRSVKLAPGVRMNFSGSGVSWTLGPRGASVGIGKRGTYFNTGIPGTGFYARERMAGSRAGNRARASSYSNISVSVGVADDGTVYFQDAEGKPLAEHLINTAKKQQGDAIRDLIQQKCDEINAQIEALGEIHVDTPNPNVKLQYQPQEFPESPPTKPGPKKPGLMGMFFKSGRERIERENQARERQFEEDLEKWRAAKYQFDEAEEHRKDVIERGIYTNVEMMENFLEENLQSIVWPRETILSTEILDNGKRVFVDVDLPELEGMPSKTASAPQRGYKLSVKEMSATQIQRLYMRHVHGIGFRIIGETFGALPNAQEVVLSAYSQRPDRTTGHVTDEYLYSVRVTRASWSRINFDNLQNLDVVDALTQFDLKRNMTKTGAFKPIEPFTPNAQKIEQA